MSTSLDVFLCNTLTTTEKYHTFLRPLICVALGMEVVGLAVFVCACWSLVVSSLFLGCWLFCLSWFYIYLVGCFVYGFELIVLV